MSEYLVRDDQENGLRNFLFVCTANHCRSPMAEFLMRDELAKKLNVSINELADLGYKIGSASTIGMMIPDGMRLKDGKPWVGEEMAEHARTVLLERGMQVPPFRSRALSKSMLEENDLVLVMTKKHLERIEDCFPGSGKVRLLDDQEEMWDPVGLDLVDFRQSAEQISRAVRKLIGNVL